MNDQCRDCKNLAGILHIKRVQDGACFELPVCKLGGDVIDTSEGCSHYEKRKKDDR